MRLFSRAGWCRIPVDSLAGICQSIDVATKALNRPQVSRWQSRDRLDVRLVNAFMAQSVGSEAFQCWKAHFELGVRGPNEPSTEYRGSPFSMMLWDARSLSNHWTRRSWAKRPSSTFQSRCQSYGLGIHASSPLGSSDRLYAFALEKRMR